MSAELSFLTRNLEANGVSNMHVFPNARREIAKPQQLLDVVEESALYPEMMSREFGR